MKTQTAERGSDALDGLRLVAALGIAVYHFGEEAPVALEQLHPLFGRGYVATTFFLLLSGFVMGRAYGPKVLDGRVGEGELIERRVTRVWPAQLAVLAALGAVFLLATAAGAPPRHPDNYSLRALVMQALLVHGWGVPGGDGWNQPSWTLSALVVCYALFTRTWRGLARIKNAAAVLATGVGVFVLTELTSVAVFDVHLIDCGVGLLRALPLFLLGVCLARASERWVLRPVEAVSLTAFGVAAVCVAQLAGRYDVATVLGLVAIIAGLATVKVGWPHLRRAADLSFALYITHALTGMVWFGALRLLERHAALAPAGRWALWAAALPVAMGVAAAFERFVDAPLQRLLSRRKRAAAQQPIAIPAAALTTRS